MPNMAKKTNANPHSQSLIAQKRLQIKNSKGRLGRGTNPIIYFVWLKKDMGVA